MTNHSNQNIASRMGGSSSNGFNGTGWYYVPPITYTYTMTMVAALMAKDGMVFISDGRVNTLDLSIKNDNQLKVFELTPLSVVLPAGGVADNLPDIVNIISGGLATFDYVNLNDAVYKFCEFWRKRVKLEDTSLTPAFIIAGYNLLPNGRYEPKIYNMQYNQLEGDWDVHETRGDNTFFANGSNQKLYYQILVPEYEKGAGSLSSRNILALKLLKRAEGANPESVGGQTTLWNLIPGKELLKLEQDEIKELKLAL